MLIKGKKKLQSLHFIINPISGISKKLGLVEKLKSSLDKNIEYTITITEQKSHATEIAKSAVIREIDAVIAVGGDGTVNEVAKVLINTPTALGIIPTGSGNGFARHLNIPMNTDNAIKVIKNFRTKCVDTGVLNEQAFVAFSGFGFDAYVSQKFNQSKHRGFLSYLQLSINEFFGYKPKEYTLFIDGVKVQKEAFLMTIANVGQYGNNAWISPKSSITDGKLDVCIIKPFPAHLALDIVFKLFNKQLPNSEYYEQYSAESIDIIKPENFHIDGDFVESDSNVSITIRPKCLRVIY